MLYYTILYYTILYYTIIEQFQEFSGPEMGKLKWVS